MKTMIKNMLHKWHWFWFKHHMDWLKDDYETDVQQAIYEVFQQVIKQVSSVADVKPLEPIEFDDFIKSPYYYKVIGNNKIDGSKVCKINVNV